MNRRNNQIILVLFYIFSAICLIVCGIGIYKIKFHKNTIPSEIIDNEKIYENSDEEEKNNVTNSNNDSTSNNAVNSNNGNTNNNTGNSNNGNTNNNTGNSNNGNTNNNVSNSNSSNTNNNVSNSNNGSTNNITNNSNGGSTTNKKTIKVTGVSLDKSSATIYLNSTSISLSLKATVKPSNATNKKITWSSSNSNIATVSSSGVVKAINPGVVKISAKTADGNKVASMTLTVKKRIVFVVGASQVKKMADYKKSYSSSKYNYKTSDGTLVYVYKGGSGMDWQTDEGMTTVNSILNSYKNVKSQVELYVYFPLVGNTIQNFVCGSDSTTGSLGLISTSNSNIKQFAKDYNSSIQGLKNSGFNVKGYVVSMHPVRVSQSTSATVVVNEHKFSCKYKYRSNWKYFKFNLAMKSIVESNYSKNLKYLSLFNKIMETNNERKNFSYKITYNTTDGIHWDSLTTKTYVNMMLGYTGDL